MSWKWILVVAVLVVGGGAYYLIHQQPDIPKEATLDSYTKRVVEQEHKAEVAVSADKVKDAQAAVERYKADKESNPPSLQDLVPHYMDHVTGGLQYDPATGVVSAAP